MRKNSFNFHWFLNYLNTSNTFIFLLDHKCEYWAQVITATINKTVCAIILGIVINNVSRKLKSQPKNEKFQPKNLK